MLSIRSWWGFVGNIVFPIAALSCVAESVSAQTAPGTSISNRADFTFTMAGDVRQGSSNTVTFTVAERLDVGVTADPTPISVAQVPGTVAAVVTNLGNGAEALNLTVQPSAGVRVDQVAIDRDGNGRFDAAVDQPLSGETPVLAPGEALHLVAVIAAVGAPVDGTLVIAASAKTGSGPANTLFPGLGDNGADAVVGPTGATASVTLPLRPPQPPPTLTKQQTVRAPDGSSRPTPGAVVTYTLIATLPSGGAHEARIEDPVPEGTRYVAESLTLDGASLTDGDDGDAGSCDGRTVAVTLGTPAAAATRTVTFQVRLP